MEKKILFIMEKQGTGKVNVRSTALVDEAEANKLNWIFQNFSGQRDDFRLFLDEFQTERIPLSHIISYCVPLSTAEISVLKKHGLETTGIINPLDLLEEFEAHQGEVIYSEEKDIFHLEGDGEIIDDLESDDAPLGSIVI